jgi:hypothetical protein
MPGFGYVRQAAMFPLKASMPQNYHELARRSEVGSVFPPCTVIFYCLSKLIA